MCCCFIASFKNQRHVVFIIYFILSNKVVTAAIRVGCFKKKPHHNNNNNKKHTFISTDLHYGMLTGFLPPFFLDFDPGSMSVYLNKRKTSSLFFFFSAIKIISLQRLNEASTTTCLTAAALWSSVLDTH